MAYILHLYTKRDTAQINVTEVRIIRIGTKQEIGLSVSLKLADMFSGNCVLRLGSVSEITDGSMVYTYKYLQGLMGRFDSKKP